MKKNETKKSHAIVPLKETGITWIRKNTVSNNNNKIKEKCRIITHETDNTKELG
jgi:hypothetical protein